MTIKSKLIILAVIPAIVIIMFSSNHIIDKYKQLNTQKTLLQSTMLIETISDLLHELQLERGLTLSYLGKPNKYFRDTLKQQRKYSDVEIKRFIKFFTTIKTNFLTKSNNFLVKDINDILDNITKIRDAVDKIKINDKDSFIYYSNLNEQLIELTLDINLYATDKQIYDKIMILKKLTDFREYAGQERAIVASIIHNPNDEQNIRKFYSLLSIQDKLYTQIHNLTQNTNINEHLTKTQEKYVTSYINEVRTNILNKSNIDKLDTKRWIKESTKRIDDYYLLEYLIFLHIEEYVNTQTEQLNLSLIYQIIISIITLFILLIGAYSIHISIKESLTSLNKGIDDFFDFLNFKSNKPEKINSTNNDEISIVINKINEQINLIISNHERDRDFINETTQIVKLMKDGNFSEKPYFEPNNPSLKELKNVFNELIELITHKIKEQTKSLEELNSSLEYRVHEQTVELENQIKEITTARDKAIQAEVAKDEFLANMSHEIRTPLNAILGFVSILKKRVKDGKNVNYLNIIDSSGKSLLTIINDILDFSKIQSGKFNISTYDIDPVDEFSNAVLLFASKAYEKHLVYAVYIDPNLPKTINVDSVRVKQILSNLLSNAIKFTPDDGEVKVKIIFEDGILIISVQDNGIGISKDNQAKVFTAFEQADGSTTRKYGGTGLGLSISSKLTSLMGGTLTLKSQKGHGSTFTLRLPVEVKDNSKRELLDLEKFSTYQIAILDKCLNSTAYGKLIKKYLNDFGLENIIELENYQEDGYDLLFFVPDDDYNEEIVNADTSAIAMLRSNTIKLANLDHIEPLYAPFTPNSILEAISSIKIQNIKKENFDNEDEEVKYKGNVLVAEDNKTNQMLISLLLEDYGIDFRIANNGVEAVEVFKQDKYDLVLMDENMPELNGIGAMKQIKEYEQKNSLIMTPIIALTASVLDSDKEMFTREGMDGFVGKPINNKDLEAEFDKYLTKG